MKNKCFQLFRAQFLSQIKVKDKGRSQHMVMAAMGILGIVLIFYCYLLAHGMGSMGMAYVIPGYAIAITGIITLFFTAVKANGVLFAYKDYDILMSLPVKTSTVIASRFLTMYVLNLIFTALVMLPMGVAYVVWEQPGFLFYPVWILGLLAAPQIPTTIATILGALIILFTSRFKYANALTTIVSVILVVAIVVSSFAMGGMSGENVDMEAIKSVGDLVLMQVNRIYPLAGLFYSATVELDMLSFLLYLVISAAWYYLFVKILSLRYKQMNTGLMTYHTRSDFKMTEQKAGSPLKALWKKEMKRFFSSTTYFMNVGIGAILAVVMGVAFLFVGADKLDSVLGMPWISHLAGSVLPFAVGMLGCMTCATSVSLSLEGKSIGILKSLPVSPAVVYKSKILMNLTILMPCLLITSACLAVRFHQNPAEVVLLFVTPQIYGIFSTVFGMYVNIKMPNYEWTNETAVIKLGLSSMAGIFGGMINGLIPLLVIVLVPGINTLLTGVIFTAAEAVLAFLMYQHIKKMKF